MFRMHVCPTDVLSPLSWAHDITVCDYACYYDPHRVWAHLGAAAVEGTNAERVLTYLLQ